MRKIILIWAVLFSQIATAQTISDIVFKKDLQGIQQQIRGINSRFDSLLNVLSQNKPPLVKCKSGPSVNSISKITSTSLTAKISGQGFDQITVSIYDEDSTKFFYTNTVPYSAEDVTVSYNLAPGKYRLYAKAITCSGVSSRAFTIKETTGGKPDCPRGPTLTEVREPTANSVIFQFDGDGVFGIDYEIRKVNGATSAIAAVGTVKPTKASVTISDLKLADGEYTLSIRGNTCNNPVPAENDIIKGFTVKTTTTGGGGTTQPPPGKTGNAVPKKMLSGIPENMNIYVEKAPGGGWLISDSSNYTPDPNHDLMYGLNNHIERRSSPLKNYLWPANTPLEIWKAQPKKSTTSLRYWSQTGGQFDPDAARGFNFNDSYPQALFWFQPADSALNASSQVPNWMDFFPDITLPKGKVWVMPIGKIDSPDLLIRKGVTHFSKYETHNKPYESALISAGRLYNEVPKTPEQFFLTKGTGVSNWVPKIGGGRLPVIAQPVGWPGPWNEKYFGELRPGQREPLTYDEGREAGRRYTTSMPLVVFENSENDHAVGSQWPFMGAFYESYVERMEAEWLPKGIKPLIAHNYFTTFAGPGLTLGDNFAENKAIFRKPLSQWPASQLLNGGTLSKTTAVCYGYYLGAPDITRDETYKFIFSAGIAKAAGKSMLWFPQSFHEDRPNNFFMARYKDGKWFYQNKKKYTPVEITNNSFFALLFGEGIVPFGAGPKTDENFMWAREWHQNKGYLWQPNGGGYQSDASYPYWSNGPEVFPNTAFEYPMAEGVRIYAQTFGKVHGGKGAFLRYRIDGKEWVQPTNQYWDDIVDAYQAKSPIVYSETKDGVTAVVYVWPYADTQLHTVEYELNGRTYTRTVHSTIIHTYMH